MFCQTHYLLDHNSSMDPNDLAILLQIAQLITNREHFAGHHDQSLPIAINAAPRVPTGRILAIVTQFLFSQKKCFLAALRPIMVRFCA